MAGLRDTNIMYRLRKYDDTYMSESSFSMKIACDAPCPDQRIRASPLILVHPSRRSITKCRTISTDSYSSSGRSEQSLVLPVESFRRMIMDVPLFFSCTISGYLLVCHNIHEFLMYGLQKCNNSFESSIYIGLVEIEHFCVFCKTS